MAKVTINPLANLDNPPSAVSRLNANFDALAAAIENTLSRDGTVPNAMQSNLDMNSNRILNLPVPVSPTEPARHGDIQQYVDQAEAAAVEAEAQANRAEAEAVNAEESADEALASLNDLLSRYVGAYASAPTVDGSGAELVQGALYFNTVLNQLHVYAIDEVLHITDNVVAGSFNVQVRHWIPIPIETYAGLNDVDMTGLVTGQIAMWNGGTWLPEDLSAGNVSFVEGAVGGANVQAAIEDIAARTSLGVYDIAFWAGGLMENAEILFRMAVSRTFWIPVGAPNSVADSRVAANAQTILLMKKNGVQFGTITYAATGTDGVFSVAGETIFNVGDILTIEAPATADTALRDTSITLACRR